MASYTNPGVYVSVTNTPVITSTTGNPINICLVGQAPATQTVTGDNYSLASGTSLAIISNPGILAINSGTNNQPNITTVAGLYNSTTYSLGSPYDYQVGLTSASVSTTLPGANGSTVVPPSTAFITSGALTLTTVGTPSAGTVTITPYLNGAPVYGSATSTTPLSTTGLTYSSTATAINSAISALFTSSTYQNGSVVGTLSTLNLQVVATGGPLNTTPVVLQPGPVSLTTTTFNTLTFVVTTSGYTTNTSLTPSYTLSSATGASQTWLTLSYTYSAQYGNQLLSFNSAQGVIQEYGSPFTKTGTINSQLSLAAYLAFLNGASQVYTIAIGNGSTSTDTSVSTSPTLTQIQYIFNNILANARLIDTIVPLWDYSTNASSYSFFNSYLGTQANLGTLQRLFLSRDTSSSGLQTKALTLGADAALFSNSRVSVIAPTTITMQTPNTASNPTINIAGFYLAAAIAGLFNSLGTPETPLTHKIVQGFTTIPNAYNGGDPQTLQSSGILLSTQRASTGDIYIRQGLTTNMSNFLTQEISIIAAQDALFGAIEKTLIDANIIGSAFTPNTPNVITALIQGTLGSAVNNNLIQAYSGIQYSIPPSNPTAVNVVFQYAPTFPLNYINVSFSIDPAAGTTSFSTTTNAFNTTAPGV